jgi:hypothetical protein
MDATRVALHPSGLAPRIVNLAEWSSYLLRRLDHQILAGPDAGLAQLAGEARGYPDLGAVVDVEDVDGAGAFIDAVDEAVGSAASAKTPGQRAGQGLTHPVRVLSQRGVAELGPGGGAA